MPTATEIDACSYLPSARHIQRTLGGIKAVRMGLGHTVTDFASGANRSRLAYVIADRGWKLEQDIEFLLRGQFGEVFVHCQKPFGSLRLDFYVYSPDGDFGVDVFYAQSAVSLATQIRMKLKKYKGYCKTLYLVYDGPADLLARDSLNLVKNVNVVSKKDFSGVIEGYSRHKWKLPNGA